MTPPTPPDAIEPPLLGTSKPPSFLDGPRALIGGVGFVVKTPSTWPLALVPVAIATALTVALSAAAIHVIPPWIAAAIGATSKLTQVLSVLAQIVSTLLAVLLAMVAALSVAQPLAGPALDRLVIAQDAAMGLPPRPEVPFWEGLALALSSLFVSLAIGGPLLIVLFLVSWLFPPAVVVTLPLKFIVTLLMLAWDFCDYPLAQRGIPVGQRAAFIRAHFWPIAGFGAALALGALIPCGLFLLLPFGVVGAARLVGELERSSTAAAQALPRGGAADM